MNEIQDSRFSNVKTTLTWDKVHTIFIYKKKSLRETIDIASFTEKVKTSSSWDGGENISSKNAKIKVLRFGKNRKGSDSGARSWEKDEGEGVLH
eukprot:snap_masked-scaffold_19-processed-gene-6.35-mRNA-1 protein AED:1.00 eAED:1.00 QI:0/0/0/0/1/1/3/0/93